MNRDFYFIGYLGFGSNQIDGQTIRTRSILKLIETGYGRSVDVFDTQLLRIRWQSFFNFFRIPLYKKLVILPGPRGINYILPLVFVFSILFNVKVYYVAIGGWLPNVIRGRSILSYILRRFERIFVQMDQMKIDLERQNIFNVRVLPNFKFYSFLRRDFSSLSADGLEVIFISRVTRDKGLDIMEKVIRESDFLNGSVRIDIYGPIEDGEEAFLKYLLSLCDRVRYCGVVEPNNVHDVMSKYDVLLFPTHYKGEGFPGVILDAFISGIPIIASNWKFNSDLIVDGSNGFIFNLDDWQRINPLFDYLYKNPNDLKRMKQCSYSCRNKYDIDSVLQILRDEHVFL